MQKYNILCVQFLHVGLVVVWLGGDNSIKTHSETQRASLQVCYLQQCSTPPSSANPWSQEATADRLCVCVQRIILIKEDLIPAECLNMIAATFLPQIKKEATQQIWACGRLQEEGGVDCCGRRSIITHSQYMLVLLFAQVIYSILQVIIWR